MIYLLATISYLLGSIPFAYIIVKIFEKADISNQGTGNIGAMNSYDITGKKWVGILVFILDTIKGFISVLLAMILMPENFYALAISSFLVIIGHNYSIFLKFKGGRGLSSAVGISILINPIFIAIWGLMWLLSYLIISKNVHIENTIAILLSPIIFMIIPIDTIQHLIFFDFIPIYSLKILYITLCIILLIKHIKPLVDYLNNSNGNSKLQ